MVVRERVVVRGPFGAHPGEDRGIAVAYGGVAPRRPRAVAPHHRAGPHLGASRPARLEEDGAADPELLGLERRVPAIELDAVDEPQRDARQVCGAGDVVVEPHAGEVDRELRRGRAPDRRRRRGAGAPTSVTCTPTCPRRTSATRRPGAASSSRVTTAPDTAAGPSARGPAGAFGARTRTSAGSSSAVVATRGDADQTHAAMATAPTGSRLYCIMRDGATCCPPALPRSARKGPIALRARRSDVFVRSSGWRAERHRASDLLVAASHPEPFGPVLPGGFRSLLPLRGQLRIRTGFPCVDHGAHDECEEQLAPSLGPSTRRGTG